MTVGVLSAARIGWDLTLHPKHLDAAYWHEQGRRFMHWDIQVARFLVIVLTLSIFRNACAQSDPRPNVWASIPAWVVLAAWLLAAVRHPRLYHQHRTVLVLVFKSALALAVVHLTNDGGRLISSARKVPTSKMLLVQATSLHGLVHLPALCVGLPLPFWMQLGWVLGRTTIFMLGGASRALVSRANTPDCLKAVSAFNRLWMRMVASGCCDIVSTDMRLQDRSSAMTVAVVAMHLSAAAFSIYLAYMSQWIQMRMWLRQKAQARLAGQQHESSSVIEVGGVHVTATQLQDMSKSSAALLLLDGIGRGALARASMACLHAALVNTILLGVVVLSHVLVLKVVPGLITGQTLSMYYPLRPDLTGDVCRPEDEPRLSGFWGGLMFVLGL